MCGETAVSPVLQMLLNAAEGRPPSPDGQAVFVSPPKPGVQAVVSFTAHAVLATDLRFEDFGGLQLDGYGAALQPTVLQRIAGDRGVIGVLDLVLVARGRGDGRLAVRTDLVGHPRVRHAERLREHVQVHGDERGLVTLAVGLAGRTEISVEVQPSLQGKGVGRSLIEAALGLVEDGSPVFAAVSPGNVRSLRAFLAVGFQPVASEVLIQRSTP